MHHFKPKQICQLLLCGDMKYKDVPETPYLDGTVKDGVKSYLQILLYTDEITQQQYDDIIGKAVEPATNLFAEPTQRKGRRGRSESEE